MSQKAVVIGGDGQVLEIADQSRAARLAGAGNIGRVVRNRRGDVVRVELVTLSDDRHLETRRGNSQSYVHDEETDTNPRGVWELRRLGSRSVEAAAYIRAAFLPS